LKFISSSSKKIEAIEILNAQAYKAFEERNYKKAIDIWKKAIKKSKKITN